MAGSRRKQGWAELNVRNYSARGLAGANISRAWIFAAVVHEVRERLFQTSQGILEESTIFVDGNEVFVAMSLETTVAEIEYAKRMTGDEDRDYNKA